MIAVSIAATAAVLLPAIEFQAGRAAERLAIKTRLGADDLTIVDDYAGYGVLTARAADATRLFARLHGMVVDPTYNAKVALAICDGVASGNIPLGATIIYVNTGGGPAIFTYGAELAGGTRSADGLDGDGSARRIA